MPVQKLCNHCKQPFTVPPRRSEAARFCSIECKAAANRCVLTCAACEKPFERPKSEGFAKYCSRNCYHSAAKGVAKNVHGRQRHHRTCEVCGAIFRVSLTRKNTARFCSRACQSKSPAFRAEMSEKQRGDKGWRWSGGRYQFKSGYVRQKGAQLDAKKTALEHRCVIEREMLKAEPDHPFLVEADGRKRLDPKIEVHHLDRNRSNNEFSNLLAVTKYAHAQIHHRNRMPERWECWPYSHAVKMLSG